MKKETLKKIYSEIKKYDLIYIVRHIGPDPDAISSQIALRDAIKLTFPEKSVYAFGASVSKFKYIGHIDKAIDFDYEKALVITLDIPNKARIDGLTVDKFKHVIKIDHHPIVDKYANIEWIDSKASSTCQMIIELVFNTKLKMTKEAAEKLYIGVVSDTNRFMFSYTSFKTFDLISKLIKKTNIDFTSLYEALYLRQIKEVRFEGYIANNLKISDNGMAYIVIDEDVLNKYEVDSATAGKMINNFNYIEEVLVWAFFSVDKANDVIRGSIRSRGPIINEVASSFGGGGHIYASGVRIKDISDVDALVTALDNVCKEYKDMHD